MLKKLALYLAISLMALMPLSVCAGDKQPDAAAQQLEKSINEIFSRIGGKMKSVRPAPVAGLYEVLIEKDGRTGIVYVDHAMKHLMQGMVLDVNSLQPVFSHPDETFKPKQPASLDVSKIPLDAAVTMGNPKGQKKLYMFTDPDCPYCRKAHAELKKLEKIAPDVAIHVMLFPLPMHPEAYDKSRTVIESKNLEQLDAAFEGKKLPKPVNEQSKALVESVIKFANENGINGTPTLVMPDGQIMVGSRDAEALKKMLE